jgi:MFS family permease
VVQIGGFVTETKSWRWTQWVILFGVAFVFALTLGMAETYKKVILKSRAKRLGVPGPPEPERTWAEAAKFFATKTVVRPLHMLFTEPIVTLFDLYVAFNFGLLNAFFAAFSWVFENSYGFDLGVVGLTYLGQAVGSLVGLCIVLYVYRVYWTKEARRAEQNEPSGQMSPDRRLIVAKCGAPLIPIS